ncbi:3-deoxy-7-phosphoheptulonate synthase [Streptomyces sp. HNM0574]|uniref:3-deoxy-7-phosphoheptulonate synthase n=1 Tax=Streptomyces sp. HNM0574 TaxID=2714954 RepID=UPI00146CEC79|nr:3-deoxy-7-phosphoheptulonate synthase [Streptomyces sp. HNM0574]NLU71018.1 3-deoxy-7-phosphoheptulonate synthase [Streptomyces sp. HNM0574]
MDATTVRSADPSLALAPGHDAVAAQQPDWSGHPDLPFCRAELRRSAALVDPGQLTDLTAKLARVAAGEAHVFQAGDCAESLHECQPAHVRAKLDTLEQLADLMIIRTGTEVLQVGRIGGQFGKPRSNDTETHEGRELPVFRGHLVNGEEPTAQARRPDPHRLLLAHRSAAAVTAEVERRRAGLGTGPWTSHEALVLDYEAPLVRTDERTGAAFLGSTHLPWIGERTRQENGAHVRMLSGVANPVGCKIGPGASPAGVVRLCRLLDPERRAGRLVLIARMGHDRVADRLPDLVRAVAASGHRPVWLLDPMHGNTVRTRRGLKTRHLTDITAEVNAARRVLEERQQHPGGLHLEVAADEVTECVGGPVAERDLTVRNTTLCDPRLSPEQAALLLEAW